jgi:hypothetical protein
MRRLSIAAMAGAALAAPLAAQSFPRLVARLSEPGGFFDTDNLVSNEASYLHAVSDLRRLGSRGGAYVGVGPDQSFSYIVALRPDVALIVDIRRDNMLLQLVFKALFHRARNRMEYLCLLFARPLPRDLGRWNERELETLLAYIDSTRSTPAEVARVRGLIRGELRRFGVPLDSADFAKIAQMHDEFVTQGPGLRLTIFGRPPRADYPDYRRLLLETDREGRRAGYLARELDFRWLKRFQRDHKLIPVVGDLSGTRAMAAVAQYLTERRLTVSAFYTSNVEQYLLRGGTHAQFARNVAALPHDARSAIVRSYFPYGRPHPYHVPGYNTVQIVQTFDAFLAAAREGAYLTYYDVVTRGVLEP